MQNNDYYKRLTVKAVLLYFALAFTVLMVSFTVFSVTETIEKEQDKMLPERLEFVRYTADKNDYGWLVDYMVGDQDYEEEFEYIWERAIMHECSIRYRIYVAAESEGLGGEYAELAAEYEAKMKEYCGNPEYPQNEPYGQYFMELATE